MREPANYTIYFYRMGKTWRDKPAKKRDIEIQKHERGNKRHMEPYNRASYRKNSWQQD